MTAQPALGVLLHAAGGFAAGTFYLPFRGVRSWAWESYWLAGGFFSWIVAPWSLAYALCPRLLEVLKSAPPQSLLWCYVFGVLWGIGGLTFGLSMRYLGMSLGYAMSLGFCATFGTLLPPVFHGEFAGLLGKLSGQVTVGGVAVCCLGIAACGWAGMRKEREVSEEIKKSAIQEFAFFKGLWVAVFAGVMSACMAFAFQAGKGIAQTAEAAGTAPIFRNFPVLVVALAGGFTTNLLWCVFLHLKNGTARDYVKGPPARLLLNYLFSACAGVTWYFQFFFYSMGTTKMGKYDFSSWSIHMAFIIVFSNLWGLLLHEWRGTERTTRQWIGFGIFLLLASIAVVGFGNYLASLNR